MRFSRRGFLGACGAGAAGALAGTAFAQPRLARARSARRGARAERVVILGFDGLDFALMSGWLSAGLLPNLARLAADGSFAPLGTTMPAESPVAWAAFCACANPGKTGIFDFLAKRENSYYPQLATAHEERRPFHAEAWKRWGGPVAAGTALAAGLFGIEKACRLSTRRAFLSAIPVGGLAAGGGLYVANALVPRELPTPVCDRLGTSFWTVAGEAGIRSAVLQAPVSFPAAELPNGRLLCGLGVPDIRKTWGTATLFDSEAEGASDTEMGGKLIGIRPDADGAYRTHILGPANFLRRGEPPVLLPVRLEADPANRRLTIHVAGQSRTLAERQWSNFFEFPFRFNSLVSVTGVGRFFLVECGRRIRLYLSPVSIHPSHVPAHVNLSYPHGYAAELAERIGPYRTLGWAIDTWSLNSGFIDEDVFLQDAYAVMRQREEMLQYELDRGDWQLLFHLFQATDRVQHMFWRFLDAAHPKYDSELARRYGGEVLAIYQEADAIVGRVRAKLKGDDVLMVMSDHGFASFARAVNVNTALARAGLLTLKDTGAVRDRRLEDLFGQGEFWPNVDWGRTEAFSLGLSQVYLNCTWREPQGIVHPGRDYRQTRARVVETLKDLRDPDTGGPVVHSVVIPREEYDGPALERAPDVILGLHKGYRVSWQTALGGIPPETVEPNLARWSGDHCSVAAPLLPGVLFANRPIRREGARIIDVGVTALDFLGVRPPNEMDGRSLVPDAAPEDGVSRKTLSDTLT